MKVSIPFKRESPSKHDYATNSREPGDGFQFPSSGKVHPNMLSQTCSRVTENGFQFPSSGKVHPNSILSDSINCYCESFNSLQAGKSIQTEIWKKVKGIIQEFQFPSSGKVHPNLIKEGCYAA